MNGIDAVPGIRTGEQVTAREQDMFDDILNFLRRWIPRYQQVNRGYLTVAIGCTGGQHRSVYFAERQAEYFRHMGSQVLIRHRELP